MELKPAQGCCELFVLSGKQATQEGAAVFTEYSCDKVDHTDSQQRGRTDMIGGAENSTQIKVETRPHKEQQEQRRAEVIQLLKSLSSSEVLM